MTLPRLLLGITLALGIGFSLVAIMLDKLREHFWLKLWLGAGVGPGITSLLFFLWRLLIGQPGWAFVFAEIVLLMILGGAAYLLSSRTAPPEVPLLHKVDLGLASPWQQMLNAGLVLGLLGTIFTFVIGTLANPHGGWDAWAIWNLAARFLFRGSEHWKGMFDLAIAHPDYPLLVSGSVARLWTYLGQLSFLAPASVAFLFELGALGLVMALASTYRGINASWIAGLAMLSGSAFVIGAPGQYADIAMGFYFLGALGCLSLSFSSQNTGYLGIAGLLLGMGLWTKNEGWLLALAVLAGWISIALVSKQSGSIGRRLSKTGWIMAGMLPFIGLALYQKMVLAPPNDLLSGQGAATLARVTDPERWLQTGKSFATQLFSMAPEASVPIGLLFVLVLIFGLRSRVFSDPTVLTVLVALVIALTGYFTVFLVTPQDLTWQLDTALYRLFTQIWPVSVLTFALLIKLPGKEHV